MAIGKLSRLYLFPSLSVKNNSKTREDEYNLYRKCSPANKTGPMPVILLGRFSLRNTRKKDAVIFNQYQEVSRAPRIKDVKARPGSAGIKSLAS